MRTKTSISAHYEGKPNEEAPRRKPEPETDDPHNLIQTEMEIKAMYDRLREREIVCVATVLVVKMII